ncbi:PREDICTED: thiamine transporter 1-like [Ceratosolen solmsi marchali]|uniref:Thiamine transporter 1-like n=1 Tax=Ceratosolen solmsi marchali TaxID=326594 RepID=A0AAJ6YFR1_9HYME|nr:PREDICTED: thiamine transporter 1-like [Ceratosolen solmsi marchali]
MKWSMISLILCIFGFLKEFRPSESFITNYLCGSWKNFTQDQINQEIYPIGTYSNFATLILVFLLTDLIRYKFVIILCGFSGTIAYVILRFATTIAHVQIVEFLYGLLLSTEVAYYTYIYAKVNKQHYQQVTSHTKVAYLLGRFTAGIVAQVTTSLEILDYEQLNYITITSLSIATVWACLLPSVNQSMYFHRVNDLSTKTVTSLQSKERSNSLSTSLCKTSSEETGSFLIKVKLAYYLLWEDFVKAYTNTHVIKWSLWWAFATCGYLQVIMYIQLLWENALELQSSKYHGIYNGYVEAIYTLISALVVFVVGNLHLNWSLVGEAILSIFSIIEGIILLISYISYNIWILYTVYISFGVIYHSIITIASFEVVQHLSEDSYGLIFGINTFFALSLQSVLTFIIINKSSLILDIRFQYLVYAVYFIILGIIFMIMSVFTLKHYFKNKKSLKIWLRNTESNIK